MPSVPFRSIWEYVLRHVVLVKTSAVMLTKMTTAHQLMPSASSRSIWGLGANIVVNVIQLTFKINKALQ